MKPLPSTIRRLLLLSLSNHDRVVAQEDGTWLVSSNSEPGAWHTISEHGCTCTGWHLRRVCRHVVRVACDITGITEQIMEESMESDHQHATA